MRITRLTAATAALTAAAILSTGLCQAAQAADGGDAGRPGAVAAAVANAGAELDTADGQQLLAALKVVEEMPDRVVAQGDAAVQAYLAAQLPAGKGGVAAFGWWQTTKCVAAITAAVAGGAVPVAKILKLKAFIKKVGSVKEAAVLLIRVAKGEEKISELGATLGGLASAILGIDGIKKHCR
ncbi:hypothetical protein ACF1AY_07065 [Streptomyces sp. NPDC014776]|uniref:hypothetical protein n=1 Tax=unclassified Streptomyces TaxID=2593676 RepID=UPI0036FD80C3